MTWPAPKPVVLAAVTILTQAFADASVSTKLPKRSRPDRFVKVTRVGGRQDNVTTDVARILVECFGPDTATVEAMCNTARAAFRNAEGTHVAEDMFVYWYGNESGPVDYPHPDIIDREKWQFTADLAISTK